MDLNIIQYSTGIEHSEQRVNSEISKMTAEILKKTKKKFLKLEKFYIDMSSIHVIISQLVFFCLCERAFMLHKYNPVTSFYTMMFFNVIAYCVSYVLEIIEREDWTLSVRIAKKSNISHLAISSTRLVLEWSKAITFLFTLSLLLMVYGVEKCIKNYSLGIPYLIITSIYYILSEKVFVDLISRGLEWSKFECFESMETLYSPVIIKGLQLALSFVFTVACGLLGHVKLAVLSSFTNIRIRYKEVDDYHWRPLIAELIRLMSFRCAEKDELLSHDDVCAVCLQEMKTARITPCKHFFHADCLRKCLKDSLENYCPLCKQKFPSPDTELRSVS